MASSFKLIDSIWRNQDVFDEVLNGNLFDAINALQQVVSGKDPIWSKVVFDILFNYMQGFFFYHFHFTYGAPDSAVDKPERQRDLEQHIRKLLQTEARELISRVCIGALHGKGWETLYSIPTFRRPFTLNPLTLFRRFLSSLVKRGMRLLQKAPASAQLGLELLGLFDHYTESEFDELFSYAQHVLHAKARYEYNEWDTLYIVRLLARPDHIAQQQHDMLVDFVLASTFSRQDIRAEILAELAATSDKAVAALDAAEGHDRIELLVMSAHTNPAVMRSLIKNCTPFVHVSMVDERLAKLGRIELAPVAALLEAHAEDRATFSSAVRIARHISLVTVEARELLMSRLHSTNPQLRYLSACALLQAAQATPTERANMFHAIMQIPINLDLWGDQDIVDGHEAHTKLAIHFLLNLAEGDPLLIKEFLEALQSIWRNVFIRALKTLLSGCAATDERVGTLVDLLLSGRLAEFRTHAEQVCDHADDEVISRAMEKLSDTYQLMYPRGGEDLPETSLIQACRDYLNHLWPCLASLTTNMSDLKSPHFAVMGALVALGKSGRNEWSTPLNSVLFPRNQKSPFVTMCEELSLAMSILEQLDADFTLDLLALLERESEGKDDYRTRERIMRSLGTFPRPTPALMSLLRKGLSDRERDVCQAAQESLFLLPRLDVEGVELVIETILAPNTVGRPDTLVEHPQPVAPSAVSRILEVLRNSTDYTSDEVREMWLVEYCLNVLNLVPQDGEHFAELYKHKLRISYPGEDIRRHLRPWYIVGLGRVRPVASDTVKMLLDLTKPGMARMMLRNLRDFEFYEIKMAAAIALTEIGADLTNGIDWNTRTAIANHLIWSAKKSAPVSSTFVGGKGVFPKDPLDAMYQCAKTMALVMKDHSARERVALQGIAGLE